MDDASDTVMNANMSNVCNIPFLSNVEESPFISIIPNPSYTPPSITTTQIQYDMNNHKSRHDLITQLMKYREQEDISFDFTIKTGNESKEMEKEMEKIIGEIKREIDPAFTFTLSDSTLTLSQAISLLSLILANKDVFSLDGSPGRATMYKAARLKTKSGKVINVPNRPNNPAIRERIIKGTRSLVDMGVVRPATSPFSSPVKITTKKDGKDRYCIDYRKLNLELINDVYPIARSDEALAMLGEGKYFTSLDICNAYWHIPLHPDDQDMTAFSTPEGLFAWLVLPFGLKTSPAIFARFMDLVLAGMKWSSCLLYYDDILSYAKTFEEHLKQIAKIFSRMHKYNLKLSLKKCSFAKKRFVYLGHVVSADGLQPKPELMDAIKNMPIPDTAKKVTSFLGLVGYYRKFIRNFSKISLPMREAVHNKPFKNTDPAFIESFRQLQQALMSPDIMLYHPDHSKPFEIHTDACMEGLGAVLCQVIDGKERVVQYISRTVTPQEQKNFSSNDLELAAIVWACDTFRPYVEGRHFILRTDHLNFKALMKTPDPGRASRWVFRLSEYDMEIIPRKGMYNANADGLSRNPLPTDPDKPADGEAIGLYAITKPKYQWHPEVSYVPPPPGTTDIRVTTWNVNSLRSVMKKGSFFLFLRLYLPDVLCITELRVDKAILLQIPIYKEVLKFYGYKYNYYHSCSSKAGYSGVAVLSRIQPSRTIKGIRNEEVDKEGRILTVVFPTFTLVTVYVPCIGIRHQFTEKRERFDKKLRAFLRTLKGPLIVTGDFNVTPSPEDAWDYKTNPNRINTASSTQGERDSFAYLLQSLQLSDIHLSRYTYFPSVYHQRTNQGLRLDLFLVNPSAIPYVDHVIYHSDVYGSDHIPVSLHLHNLPLPTIRSASSCSFSSVSSTISRAFLPSLASINEWLPLASSPWAEYVMITNEEFKKAQHDDPQCQEICHKMQHNQQIQNYYHIIDDVLYRYDADRINTYRPVVPLSARRNILFYFHGLPITGHLGYKRTYHAISTYYYWKNMGKTVKKWVRSCLLCAKRKTPRHPYQTKPISDLASRPWQRLSIDHNGPHPTTQKGNKYILNGVCTFSHYAFAHATKTTNAMETADYLYHLFMTHGFPETISSDRGSAFIDKIVQAINKQMGVRQIFTTSYQPQSNSPVERFHRFVQECLTIFTNENKDDWDDKLACIIFAYNISNNEQTGYSPFELETGRAPRLPLVLFENSLPLYESHHDYFTQLTLFLKSAFERVREQQKRNVELRAKYVESRKIPQHLRNHPPIYTKGDFVLVYDDKKADAYSRRSEKDKDIGYAKISYKWRGPHIIEEDIPPIHYRVRDLQTNLEEKVHLNRLVPYVPFEETDIVLPDYIPTVSVDIPNGNVVAIKVHPSDGKGLSFRIAKILEKYTSKADVNYLVHWYGQASSKASLESVFLPAWQDNQGIVYYKSSPQHPSHKKVTSKDTNQYIWAETILATDLELIYHGKVSQWGYLSTLSKRVLRRQREERKNNNQ